MRETKTKSRKTGKVYVKKVDGEHAGTADVLGVSSGRKARERAIADR